MNALTITPLYAGAIGLILLGLSLRVVQVRLAREVSLGDAGHPDLLVAQRAQGNLIEYAPVILLLVALLEANGWADWIVHALGALLTASRLAHPFGLAPAFGVRPARALGAAGTWLVLAISSVLAIWTGVTAP